MDALHPRLLVDDFPGTFRFYRGLLEGVAGATPARGAEEGPYASWDLDGQTLLSLYDRAAMAADVGAPAPAPRSPGQDVTVLVLRVPAGEGVLEAAAETGECHGGTLVAAARALPGWGPTLRAAHLRDPEGNLVELQSY
ncbi:glyoxalase/bleomycin resistance/extradiol dioxygenase family protein [Streptosporangium sp. NPDC000239]|uniref:glyoxalase/bleomycin resistance/extradiol dioxygenase family protein n=1 Tax=Streptosporangium sp. NPDC000239 TaxID=3154248 RepID=UPI0033298412